MEHVIERVDLTSAGYLYSCLYELIPTEISSLTKLTNEINNILKDGELKSGKLVLYKVENPTISEKGINFNTVYYKVPEIPRFEIKIRKALDPNSIAHKYWNNKFKNSWRLSTKNYYKFKSDLNGLYVEMNIRHPESFSDYSILKIYKSGKIEVNNLVKMGKVNYLVFDALVDILSLWFRKRN